MSISLQSLSIKYQTETFINSKYIILLERNFDKTTLNFDHKPKNLFKYKACNMYIRKNDKLVESTTTIYYNTPTRKTSKCKKRWTVYNSVFEMNKFLSLFDHRKIAQSVSM